MKTNHPQNNSSKPISRHIMALLTFLALLPLVYFIPPWVAEYISDQHGWVTLISVAIIVPIISYLILPGMLFLISTFKIKAS